MDFSPFVIIEVNLCKDVLLHWQISRLHRAADIIKIIHLIIIIIIIIVINVHCYLKDADSDVYEDENVDAIGETYDLVNHEDLLQTTLLWNQYLQYVQ